MTKGTEGVADEVNKAGAKSESDTASSAAVAAECDTRDGSECDTRDGSECDTCDGSECDTHERIPTNERFAGGIASIECMVRIGGVEFVLVPATRDTGVGADGSARHGDRMTKRRLWEARQEAKLTQAQLACRLGVSQAMVCRAESGQTHVSERYVGRVLEACELPARWGLPEPSSEPLSGWDLDPKDIAGFDPATAEPVRRGSERDLELGRTVLWWDNFRGQD